MLLLWSGILNFLRCVRHSVQFNLFSDASPHLLTYIYLTSIVSKWIRQWSVKIKHFAQVMLINDCVNSNMISKWLNSCDGSKTTFSFGKRTELPWGCSSIHFVDNSNPSVIDGNKRIRSNLSGWPSLGKQTITWATHQRSCLWTCQGLACREKNSVSFFSVTDRSEA